MSVAGLENRAVRSSISKKRLIDARNTREARTSTTCSHRKYSSRYRNITDICHGRQWENTIRCAIVDMFDLRESQWMSLSEAVLVISVFGKRNAG
jgi:hypothetical protein